MNDLSSGFFAALLGALLASVWQGAIIGAAAAACLHWMRRNTPQARYLVACLALASCVLLPLLTFVAGLCSEHGVRAEAIRPSSWIIAVSDDLAFRLARILAGDGAPYLVWGWLAGCSLLLARSAAAVAWLERAMHKPQPADRRTWQLRIDSLAARMGIAQPVRLLLCDDLPSPAVVNLVRPVVFLPIAVTTRMPTDWVEALLAHELAHIRRHDYLVNLIQKLIEALLFHQPAVWWLSSRIRHERELIADLMAVEAGADRRTLAAALAELVELREAGARLPDLALCAHGGRLMSRIRSLVRPATPVAARHAVIPAIALLAVAAILSIDTSTAASARYAASRAELVEPLRPAHAAASVPERWTASVRDAGTARAATAVTAAHANPSSQTHRSEAPEHPARLARLGGLNRIGEVSAPMAVVGTRLAPLGTGRAELADGDRRRQRTP